ncbi:MAG: site-specific DNA-methyltransferase [Victivallaceae bacterium]
MKPYYQDELITLYHGDCREIIPQLDVKFNALITDPPYPAIGMAWEKDSLQLFDEVIDQVCLAPKSFLSVFSLMPVMVQHFLTLSKKYKYTDHITWAKRNVFRAYLPLLRTHEEILIFRNYDSAPLYVKTKGNFTDVKIPGLKYNLCSINNISRCFSALFSELKNGKPQYINRTEIDSYKSQFFGEIKKINSQKDFHRRFSESCNYTNLWSFYPDNLHTRKYNHPTTKPLRLMGRLIELLTGDDQLILDPFAGSGSTGVAAKQLGRRCVLIEQDEKYCEVAAGRICAAIPSLFGAE